MESVIFSFADWPAPPDGFPEFGPLRARRAPPARCGPSTARFSRCRPRIRLISDLIDRLSQCRARVTTDSGASRKLSRRPRTPGGPSPGGAALTPISGPLIASGAGVRCSGGPPVCPSRIGSVRIARDTPSPPGARPAARRQIGSFVFTIVTVLSVPARLACPARKAVKVGPLKRGAGASTQGRAAPTALSGRAKQKRGA